MRAKTEGSGTGAVGGAEYPVNPLLVDERTAGKMLGLSPKTLQGWRLADPPKGPRAIRVGGFSVRYRVSDLVAYVEAQTALAGRGTHG